MKLFKTEIMSISASRSSSQGIINWLKICELINDGWVISAVLTGDILLLTRRKFFWQT